MTDKDRDKWDSRYRKRLGGTDPSPILKKYCGLASCGNALDIACGNGRNSMFLAAKGFVVDAVDISTVATSHLAGKIPLSMSFAQIWTPGRFRRIATNLSSMFGF